MITNHGFVGVHVGAGHHSFEKTDDYKLLCKLATEQATDALSHGKTAMEATVMALELLENSPHTNAGFGSNLTDEGTVECDAGIMDGYALLFGGVGAAAGIRNPISVAKKLVDEQKGGLRGPLGQVPPSFLVGPAVKKWAHKKGIETCSDDHLISDASMKSFLNYKRKRDLAIGTSVCKNEKKRRLEDVCNIVDGGFREEVSDTVGAVVCDRFGNVAAATSSGGIALKHCGRVGQAAVYGCGCWSQNGTKDNGTSIAVSTSGCGEYLIRTCFAKECACYMLREGFAVTQMKEFIEKKFLESPVLKRVDEKLAGAIVFKHDTESGLAEFLWSHTTHSMCLGYMSTTDKRPTIRMSRLPENGISGRTIVVEGTTRNLSLRKTTITTTV